MTRLFKTSIALAAGALLAGAAATGIAAVAAAAWATRNPKTRTKAKLVRAVLTGAPAVANTKIHGTLNLAHSRGAVVHNTTLTAKPHHSDARIFMSNTHDAEVSWCQMHGGCTGVTISDNDVAPDRARPADAPPKTAADGQWADAANELTNLLGKVSPGVTLDPEKITETLGVVLAAHIEGLPISDEPGVAPVHSARLRQAVGLIWTNRPAGMRTLPTSDQKVLVVEMIGQAITALTADLNRQQPEPADVDEQVNPEPPVAERPVDEPVNAEAYEPGEDPGRLN